MSGGEVYETIEGGRRAHWADVLVWEPPHRFVIAWSVNPERPAPTEVEVTFTAEGTGTRVALEHRGWERLDAEGQAGRASYAEDWPGVLARFASAARRR